MNEKYIQNLVNWITKKVINPKTNEPFKLDDILDINYKNTVETILNQQE